MCFHPRVHPHATRRPVLLGVLLVASVLVQLYGLYDPAPGGGDVAINDKVVHALLFGVPALLGGLVGLGRWWPVVLAVHAPLSELVQGRYYATRTGDPWDAVADLLGIALGWALAALVARRRRPAPAP